MKTESTIRGFYFRKGWVIYLVCLLLGLNIKVTQGLYLYDIVVVVSVLMALPRIAIKKDIAFFVIAGIAVSVLTVALKPGYVNLNSFYVPWNLLVFLFYCAFLIRHKNTVAKLNYNLVVLFLMLPIVVSCLMFVSPGIEAFVRNLYDLPVYPAFGRYGGVFEKNVNAFGLISSVLLLFVLALYKFGRVSSIVFMLMLFFCLFGVMLSGMRAGLIVILGTLLLFNWTLRLVKLKHVIVGSIAITSLFVVAFWYIFDSKLANFILERFSVARLTKDLSASPDGGNLRTAIKYFYRTLGDAEITAYTALFGVDSTLNYVDNLYVFLFIKHGAVALIVFGLLFVYFLTKALLSRNYFLLFLIIFSAILSMKGIFVLSNVYMFIMILLYVFWIGQRKEAQRLFQWHYRSAFV